MKLFIASDIHGSAHYCRLMTEKFCKSESDKLVLLGDILYHGPRNDLPAEYDPKAVIAMLNPLADKILAVRGNCEAEVDSMVLNFNVASDYATLFCENVTICATHGHRNVPCLGDGDILLCGHTHIPTAERRDKYVYLNPGSVSIPKENSPHSYMIFDGMTFRWYDIESGECYKEYALSEC